MSLIEVENLSLQQIELSSKWGIQCVVSVSSDECANGMAFEFTSSAAYAGTSDVFVFNTFESLTPSEMALEIAKGTVYSVNTAAAAERYLGTLTFDFKTATTNTLWIKAGTKSGAITFPTVMAPLLTFVFDDFEFPITRAVKTKKGTI